LPLALSSGLGLSLGLDPIRRVAMKMAREAVRPLRCAPGPIVSLPRPRETCPCERSADARAGATCGAAQRTYMGGTRPKGRRPLRSAVMMAWASVIGLRTPGTAPTAPKPPSLAAVPLAPPAITLASHSTLPESATVKLDTPHQHVQARKASVCTVERQCRAVSSVGDRVRLERCDGSHHSVHRLACIAPLWTERTA
jgi:hypothetical protein